MPSPDTIKHLDQDIRAAVAEIWQRVTAWRDSPGWTDNEHNHNRYDQTAAAVTAVDQSPPLDLPALTQAVQPILTTWRPNRTGPEQPIYAAADRLRAIVQQHQTRQSEFTEPLDPQPQPRDG